MKPFLTTLLLVASLAQACLAADSAAITSPLFTQTGTDPTFDSIKTVIAQRTKTGVTGSTIHVNQQLVETLPGARRPIASDIKLHTLLNSSIGRRDFSKWSRWYQESGHTQVFRLFKGEVNMHNSRALAGRVEAFSQIHWTEAQGQWHEWSGVVTPIKPVGMNLQVKNSDNDWAVAIFAHTGGKVKIKHRRGQKKEQIIDTGAPGKPFLLGVRDNGLNYEVSINSKKVAEGSYKRPAGATCFRWGMYVGETEIREDAMILFSGVTVDGTH